MAEKRNIKRAWGGSDSDVLRYLIEDFASKFEWVDVTIDPGSINAGAELTTNTALPGGVTAAVGDLVFPVVPSALEAGIYMRSVSIAVANQVRVVWRNETGGAVDPASRAYTFLIVRKPRIPVVI